MRGHSADRRPPGRNRALCRVGAARQFSVPAGRNALISCLGEDATGTFGQFFDAFVMVVTRAAPAIDALLMCAGPLWTSIHLRGPSVKKTLRGVLAAAAVTATAVFGAVTPASAAGDTVGTTAASWTPYVTSANAYVRKLAQCGGTLYAVGTFTQVAAPGVAPMTRNNAFSFNATTGAISAWNPNVNGTVQGIALSADCSTAYLAGTFTTVHGTTVKNLVKVNTTTGAVDTAFKPAPNGDVNGVVLTGGHLIAGGSFTTIGTKSHAQLASLSPTTGSDDGYVNLNITGTVQNAGRKVWRLALNHSASKLLVMGSFASVSGNARQQIFMADLGGASASLNAWNSPEFLKPCMPYLAYYLQAATFSPNDDYVYTVTTGRYGTSSLCDTVAKFPVTADSNLNPLWTNPTGCDSLFSVAADSKNIYAGGHQRWMNNFGACEVANPGSVTRAGIASVDPDTGLATSWNPGRSRGKGADDMLLTSAGLWVASDNTNGANNCAGQYHPGICFLPY
jgi:hypothetical protein